MGILIFFLNTKKSLAAVYEWDYSPQWGGYFSGVWTPPYNEDDDAAAFHLPPFTTFYFYCKDFEIPDNYGFGGSFGQWWHSQLYSFGSSGGIHKYSGNIYTAYNPYGGTLPIVVWGLPSQCGNKIWFSLDLNDLLNLSFSKVKIIKPQNNEVITNQNYPLNFFGVDYYLPDAATGTTANLYLDYYNLNQSISYEEQFYLPIDDYTISTSTQFYFGKSHYLANDNYKAKAYIQYQLAGTTTQAIIYSDETYFTINEAGGVSYSTSTTSTIPIPNFEDICIPPQGGFLDYPVQNISYALCKVFSYLFIPNQEQQQNIQNRFSSFQDIIKSKPPLGYFYKIKDALNQNITAGNATTTQVLNTSTTQAFSAVFSPLKTGLNWILWLAAGSWVFIKIKNLNI